MDNMFGICKSLISLPDLSKWNTANVTDISYMFDGCNSLISLPDIMKWNISKVTIINNIFYGCQSLISLPDLSKWIADTNIIHKNSILENCFNSLNKIVKAKNN